MDNKELLKLFQNAILLLVLTFVIVIYMIVMKIVPSVTNINSLSNDYKAAVEKQATLEKQYDSKKSALMQATNVDLTGGKDMYKPMDSGLDASSIVAGQFEDILAMLRATSVKARSVDYAYNPPEDEFVKGAGAKVSACQVTLQLVATYKNFENFMRDLYKHEHFLDISKIEIIPYEKNKTILLINCKISLYAKKV